jgi:glycosyltransferase involved in cell wall biosynthesis
MVAPACWGTAKFKIWNSHMNKATGKISIIMPAYNEEARLYENILEVGRVLEEDGAPFEIIVVDDGSQDRTLAQAQKAAGEFAHVLVVQYPVNAGKGQALREGFARATGDYVVFLDSDLDLPPGQIRRLLDILEKEGADAVIGSKRHPESQVQRPWQRKVLSNGYYFLVKLMFGLPLRDTQTGLKIFRCEVLKKVLPRLRVRRFAFDLELLAVAHQDGYKIAEAPVVVRHRRKFGRIGFWPVWETWRETLGVFYRMKISQDYDGPAVVARGGEVKSG